MGEVFINSEVYKRLVQKIDRSVTEVKQISEIPNPGTDVLSDIIALNEKIVNLTKQYKEHIQLDLVPSYKKTEEDLLKVNEIAIKSLVNGASEVTL